MKTYPLPTDTALKRYDYLWKLSQDRWAWEYLRRNPEFLRDAESWSDDNVSRKRAACGDIQLLRSRIPQNIAERWGLTILPDPSKNGFEADVFWSIAAYPNQVEIHCGPRAKEETCDIWERTLPVCKITHLTDRIGREHLLLRGNGCVAQIRCTGLSLLGLEPVRMKLTISDMEAYDRKIRVQKEGMEVYGNDQETEQPLWSKRTQMLRDGLIVLDCLALGMSQREIACVLYGAAQVDIKWCDGTTAMRDAIRYLIKKAEGLRDGGYLMELLGAQLGPAQAAA